MQHLQSAVKSKDTEMLRKRTIQPKIGPTGPVTLKIWTGLILDGVVMLKNADNEQRRHWSLHGGGSFLIAAADTDTCSVSASKMRWCRSHSD